MISFKCSNPKFLLNESSPYDEILFFFSNGVPIGSFSSDNEFILFSADGTKQFNLAYFRLWLLFQNTSNTAFLLEPYNLISLEAEGERKIFAEYEAESPTKILSAIDEKATAALIFESIGSALEALTVENATIKSNTGEVYEINDKNDKRELSLQQNNSELRRTANRNNIFKISFSSEVLRINTVFLTQSLNGYLYFSLGKVNGSDWRDNHKVDVDEHDFNIIIRNKIERVKLYATAV